MDNNFVVTFARGFGSGGKEIASKLAHELGINCYENRILTLASQLSGLDEEVFKAVDEKVRTNGGFSNFLRGLPKPAVILQEMRNSYRMIRSLNTRKRL